MVFFFAFKIMSLVFSTMNMMRISMIDAYHAYHAYLDAYKHAYKKSLGGGIYPVCDF